MMNKRNEFHPFVAEKTFDYIILLIIFVIQISEVLISSYEGLVAKLLLKIDSERLDSIAHGIRGLNTRKIFEEFWINSHVWRLLMKLVFVRRFIIHGL